MIIFLHHLLIVSMLCNLSIILPNIGTAAPVLEHLRGGGSAAAGRIALLGSGGATGAEKSSEP